MKKVNVRAAIIEIICFLFIFLFVYAAVAKLADYQKFTVQLGQSPMLTKMAGFVAWFIPSVEILISVMLVFVATRKIALYAALNLMVIFTVYIIVVTNFSKHVPCSCGGVLERLGWTEHLLFNTGFVVLSIVGIILTEKVTRSSTSKVETSLNSLSTTESL